MKVCHACGAEWKEHHPPGRMETCLSCRADMHCCLNCDFFDTSRSRDCSLPETDPPSDKSRWNDCEQFRLADKDSAQSLPTEDRNADAKKKWDALFKPDA